MSGEQHVLLAQVRYFYMSEATVYMLLAQGSPGIPTFKDY